MDADSDARAEEKAITRGIKAGVTLALLVMTFITMRYVNKKIDEVKDEVIYARRKARYASSLLTHSPPLLC